MADEGSSDSPDCEGAVQKKQQEKGKAFIQNLKKVIPCKLFLELLSCVYVRFGGDALDFYKAPLQIIKTSMIYILDFSQELCYCKLLWLLLAIKVVGQNVFTFVVVDFLGILKGSLYIKM